MKKNILLLNSILLLGSLSLAQQQVSTAPTAMPVSAISKTGGRPPSKDLIVKKSGVAQFNLVKKGQKLSSIPRIDIGEEPTIAAIELGNLNLPQAKKIQMPQIQKVKSPQIPNLEKSVSKKGSNVGEAKVVLKPNPNFKTPEIPVLKKIDDPTLVENKLSTIKIDDLTNGDEKLLQALIFLEIHKNYNLAFGLLSELLQEKDAKNKWDASYQLGLTAKALGVYSDFRYQMIRLMKEANKDWQRRAAIALALYAESGDTDAVPLVDAKIDEFKAELDDADQYQINRAKYYLAKGEVTAALSAVDQVDEKSKYFGDAMAMKSLILYRANKLEEATKTQEIALARLEKDKPESEIKSISALTLARLYFQQNLWKDAFNAYLKVHKNHPEWPQAMVEQAWTQILSQDYEGAAGNMFTLHTDFFKSRFSPESYVVRTVGYLNLCQYGDGAMVVQDLQRKYTPVQKVMADFKAKKEGDLFFYETVKSAFKNQEQKAINGLPKALIFELARNPEFMTQQGRINNAEEQMTKLNNITLDLITQERAVIKKQSEAQSRISELAKSPKDPGAVSQKTILEERLLSYKLQQQMV
jgi:tetratricopeptide (TPR) repeat protein